MYKLVIAGLSFVVYYYFAGQCRGPCGQYLTKNNIECPHCGTINV